MLFLGPVREYRGIDVALIALSQLNSDFFLIIAGESPSGYDYYHKKIRDLNLIDKVLLIERKVNENEIPYFFAAADVLLMPFKEHSTREFITKSFGYELPVIASDVGNFREMFETNNFGLIIDEPVPEQLINAINKYYDENLETVFKTNLSNVRYNNSWESLATMIYDIYDKLAAKDDVDIY
jgi:glycosyltransferase involved in cell wall biosynthesis